MNLFFNGEIIKEEELKLGPENRALNYGDGLFETMKFSGEKTWYLKDHYERIQAGTEAFSLRLPGSFTLEFLERNVRTLASENKINEARIKLLIWRKNGGLFSPESEEIDYLIMIKPWHSSPAVKARLSFSAEKKSYSALSRFKLLSSAPYIMAGIEKKKNNMDDMIILNHKDEIVECLSSNIFWEKDSVLYTPAVETGCIEGVMRKQVIARLKTLGVSIEQGHYRKEKILNADFAFTSNIGGLSTISAIENKEFNKESGLFNRLTASL